MSENDKCPHDAELVALRASNAKMREELAKLRALPADPRAAAAVRLAEAVADEGEELADDMSEGEVRTWIARAQARLRERREALAAWRSLAQPEPAPHSCQTHRATKGAANCGLTPCEEAMIHTPGETRPARTWRKPEPAPERCGGVNCANPRCHYMVWCAQQVCDKCGTRVQPCPRCAKGGSHD